MLGIIGFIILFVLLFDGHTIRKQNEELLKQNNDILETVKILQQQLEQKQS